MKKSTLLGLALGLLTAGSAFAEKDNVFGVNPLAAVFGYYSGEYGRFIKDGAAEINVPFTYYSYDLLDAEISGFGIGANYRLYKNKNKVGLFYGGGVDYAYTANKLEGFYDISYHKIIPAGVLGYRWTWESGFTLAPSASLGYQISTAEDQTTTRTIGGMQFQHTEPVDDAEKSKLYYGLGLGFGWTF